MQILRTPLIATAAATAVMTVVLLALGVQAAGAGAVPPIPIAVCGLTLIALFGVHGFSLLRDMRDQATARRFLELLGQHDIHSMATSQRLESLPTVDSDSPWHATLDKMRDCVARLGEGQESAATVKAALEIRLQRTSGQFHLAAAALSHIDEAILAVNAYDEVQLANTAAESLLKLGAAGSGKRRVGDWLGSDRLKQWLGDLRRKKAGTERTEDFELVDTSGALRWFRVTAANLNDDSVCGDGAGGAVVVFRDVDEQKSMQRRHAEFVSTASHEMKAPLAGIKAYVELLADGEAETEEARDEFFDVINGQTDRLQRMIDNLLNIARIEAGVVRVSKQSRSVNEVLTEALGVIGPSAEAKHIRLTPDLSELYLGALIDRDMFLQAVINLLSNAVKYTPTGGQVTLRSRLNDQEIVIEVEDTGVGLSEDDCRRVFEKFYRVEKDKTMAGGTGLGLALVQHIVEDVHGGRIAVRSTPGVGSVFSITVASASRTTATA